MSEPTLVILAAGLSTRYGSPKQIEPVGPDGEFIIDYSVYDAVRAGFKRVVFLIAPGMLEDFEAAIGRRVAGHVETAYAFQSLDRLLPPGYAVPEGRKRPWGTSHAVLCCREVVDGPFAMINADDFYGRGAFRLIYDALKATDTAARPMRFSMVGYELGKTVTPSGKVCRGVCRTSGGKLESIEERTYVVRTPEGPAYSLDGGETLKIWKTRLTGAQGAALPPGACVGDAREGLFVKCADELLELLEVQAPGGRRLDGRAFLRGRPLAGRVLS